MVRPFLLYPDKRLRTVCAPIPKVDTSIHDLWKEMLNAMYAMPGVGLAANQLGDMRRVIVVDCSDKGDAAIRMANPEILHASVKLRSHDEGSPNIPGFRAVVERPRAVTVRYLDENGVACEKDFVGLWATSVQHQIDHLNGKLFVDHLSPLKRRMILGKHTKRMKRDGRNG